MLRQALRHLNNGMLSLSRASSFSPLSCPAMIVPCMPVPLSSSRLRFDSICTRPVSWTAIWCLTIGHGATKGIYNTSRPPSQISCFSPDRLKEQSVSSFGCLLDISAWLPCVICVCLPHLSSTKHLPACLCSWLSLSRAISSLPLVLPSDPSYPIRSLSWSLGCKSLWR